MSIEEGYSGNPHKRGTLQWWIWEHHIGPIINPATVQRTVDAENLNKYLQNDWVFVTQLKSGAVLVEKALSAEKIVTAGLQQVKQQALAEKY